MSDHPHRAPGLHHGASVNEHSFIGGRARRLAALTH
jgi:hypothetical protein